MTHTINRKGLEQHLGNTVTIKRNTREITGELSESELRTRFADPKQYSFVVEYEIGGPQNLIGVREPLRQGEQIGIRYGPKKVIHYQVDFK